MACEQKRVESTQTWQNSWGEPAQREQTDEAAWVDARVVNRVIAGDPDSWDIGPFQDSWGGTVEYIVVR